MTDVLTFDYADADQTVEGDIYISLERVKANAQVEQHAWVQELRTVMVHGVLHLVGYNDQHPAEKAVMRQKEALYLQAWKQ